MKIFLLLLSLLYTNSFVVFSKKICKNYKQHYLSDKFTPVLEEKTLHIVHNNVLFNSIENNIFIQIGSNPKHIEDEDYHWFDGDGMFHSVFFNKSGIEYQNKWIQTRRLQIEDKWNKKLYLYFGELHGIHGLFQIMKYTLLETFGFISSNTKGTANTALLNWNNRLFALHEGDMPYELFVNKSIFDINTVSRLNYTSITSTTAHPIIDKKRKLLYLYGYNNYDFLKGNFIFNVFNEDLHHLKQKNISLLNNGMTHDVGFVDKYMIIPDMPLKYDMNRIFNEQLPMYFDKTHGTTRFGVFDVTSDKDPEWYYFNENFFIFHFARVYKKGKKMDIFACVMDDLHMEDFVELDNIKNENHTLRGNLRLKKIELNIQTNTTKIIENPLVENLNLNFSYNLDFPILSKLNNNNVYCTIFDSKTGYIKGYVKINMENFEKSKPIVYLFDKDTYGNSEPQVIVINDIEYLLTFTNDNKYSYISLVNIMKNINQNHLIFYNDL